MSRRAEALRLALFCAIVILAAAIVVWPFSAKKERFDTQTFAQMQVRQPRFVLIGDSLVGYSIDPPALEAAIDGQKVNVLWYGGAASAAWYLYLKNFVVGAGLHPRRVFIFIHDAVLTDPQFRTTGKYAQELQRLCHPNEPLFAQLTKRNQQQLWWLPRLVARLFPADNNRAHYQQKVDGWVRRLVAKNRHAARELAEKANQTFDVANVRADEPVVLNEPEKPFDAAVGESFLPPMLQLARDNHFPITFVRPKKRPGRDAEFDAKPQMQQYYSELRHYLAPTGCDLVDLTNDPVISSEMFADAVHIAPSARIPYTKHFAELLADHFR